MVDWFRKGTTREQLGARQDSVTRSVRRSHPDAEPSDPPSADAARHIEKVSKPWGLIVGMLTGALVLVDVGTRLAARNDAYATVKALDKIDARLSAVEGTLVELKVSDLKPLAEQASRNAIDAQGKVDATNRTLARVVRGINGFNAVAERRGQITPIPIQETP